MSYSAEERALIRSALGALKTKRDSKTYQLALQNKRVFRRVVAKLDAEQTREAHQELDVERMRKAHD